jgi:2-isopropylmalate synthase
MSSQVFKRINKITGGDKMSRIVKIFDTTLRDGEQSPGCSMNLKEKLEMAKQLERLKIDVIEAGFAIASPGDFESVQLVANEIKNATVASLARSTEKDISTAYEAIKTAVNPRIHFFIATSDLHMEYKLKMKPDAVLLSRRCFANKTGILISGAGSGH